MASTPKVSVLSSKELNKTLSAKKKPLKTLKNILSSKNLDWPVLEDACIFFEELISLDLNKTDEESSYKVELRKNMLFGVNQIGRCINRDECVAVILDAEIPRMLISHLMQSTLAKNIPSLLVPGLRNFLLNNLGFKCSALCLKSKEERFRKLLQIVSTNHDHHQGLLQASEDMDLTTQKEAMDNSSTKVACEEPSVIVYLKRPSDKLRAFNPPSSKKVGTDSKPKEGKAEAQYIKLNKEDTQHTNQKKKSFRPLYVKRIQNNPKRKGKKQK